MITDASQQRLDETRRRVHARCFACGGGNGRKPRICFETQPGGVVQAIFHPRVEDEGYGGRLHGGVIATLLDAAMTNCLFAHGRCGVTADLHLRYRHPVSSTGLCSLGAWIERSGPPLFVLRAELWQDNHLRASATGKFMQLSDPAPPASIMTTT